MKMYKLKASISVSSSTVSLKRNLMTFWNVKRSTHLTTTHSMRAKRICSALFCQLNALCCYFFAKLQLPQSFHSLLRKFIFVLAKYSFCRFTNFENMSISFSMSVRLSDCPVTREHRDRSPLLSISGVLLTFVDTLQFKLRSDKNKDWDSSVGIATG
jgi:hypothetical protein